MSDVILRYFHLVQYTCPRSSHMAVGSIPKCPLQYEIHLTSYYPPSPHQWQWKALSLPDVLQQDQQYNRMLYGLFLMVPDWSTEGEGSQCHTGGADTGGGTCTDGGTDETNSSAVYESRKSAHFRIYELCIYCIWECFFLLILSVWIVPYDDFCVEDHSGIKSHTYLNQP